MTDYKKSAVSLALAAMFTAPSAYAANSEEMVQSIMKLRADVESLYTQIDGNKEHYKAEMKSLAMQQADNKAQINRKETDIKLAQLELEKIKVKIASTSTKSVEIRPLLERGAALIKTSIQNGLPFKVQERIAVIDGIFAKLDEGLITQEKALQLLWAGFDDNLRLTREIGMFKQQIRLDGKDVQANVAKIGSVMLFFSAPDGRVGHAVKQAGAYRFRLAADEEEKAQINALFDALHKQIRTGYFTVPNALVLMENK